MPVLLPSPVFRWFVPAQNGTGLVPAAGYKAKFYDAGTTDPKAVYDVDGTIYPSPSNEVTLNSEGYAGIKLGNGTYKLVVTNSFDSEVYSQDNISGGGTFGSGFVPTVIATDDPPTNGLAEHDTTDQFTWCSGYWAVGDGGHGFFYNEESAAADDGGYVIASTFAPGRVWRRIPDESGDVRAASFGYIGTRTENLSDEILAACSYCQAYGKRLVIGPGDEATIGTDTSNFYLYAPFVHLEAGSMLTGTGDFDNFVITGYLTGTPEQHFTDAGYLLISPQLNANPEWSGGSYGSANNAAAFAIWLASLPNGGAFALPPGIWAWNGDTASFPYPSVPFTLYGTIDGTTGADIPPGVYYPAVSRFRAAEFRLPNSVFIRGDSGTAATLTGDLATTGSITSAAGANINAGGNMTALGDIVAGFDGTGGGLYSHAGSGTKDIKSGGMYGVTISNATTSGTGATNLLSMSILANSFVAAGDMMRIRIAGTTSGASSANTVAVKIGSVTVATVTITGGMGGFNWIYECDLWLKGSTTAYSTAKFLIASSASVAASVQESTGLDFTTTQTLQIVGTAATSGSMTQNILSIEYIPLF